MSAYSFGLVRTTVRMEDELLRRAKRIAARRDTTLTAILEEALREWLDRQKRGRRSERVELPVSRSSGGVLPGVEIDDSADLLDRMEDDAPD